MGSPVSPIVANLFMEAFESTAISTALHPPKLWLRYVDDTFNILKREWVRDFTEHINSQHRAIKFTSEEEEDSRLPMLDTLFSRQEDGSLKCSVYRKPTHTDQYLHFGSHHPLQHKLGVIRTLMHRADTIITSEEDKIKEVKHVKQCLEQCGYKPWVYNVCDNKEKEKLKAKNKDRPKAKGSVVIPFVKGISEPMARLFQAKGVRTHYKPFNSLRRNLVVPKDKVKMEQKSGTVYHIPCNDCPATYVGESERSLKTRLAEHRRPSSVSSPVAEHTRESQHSICWSQVKVLDQDSDWYCRGVREAINIRRESSTLNRDRGRHDLPPIYNTIVLRGKEVLRDTPNL